MARKKGSINKKTASRFKPFEGRRYTDRHIRLTKDFLMDNRCLALSANALRLYIYLKLWACGQEEVTYSISLSRGYMSAPTFLKAKQELISNGFILQVNGFAARYKKETCIYRFIDGWSKE